MKAKKPVDVRGILKKAKLRATPARIAVCNILLAAHGPLTHAEVADQLEISGTDRTTVFRNLTDLCEAGLARRMEVGDHVYRFEWKSPTADDSEHAHFVCVDCGEVQCLPASAKMPIPKAGQRPEQIHDVVEVLYRGHCTTCVH